MSSPSSPPATSAPHTGFPSSSVGRPVEPARECHQEAVIKQLEGKVALVTGAARGQGRSHAVRFAEQGADVCVIDITANVDTATYDMASPDDLERTGQLVLAQGARVIVRRADVRDLADLTKAVEDTVSEFGRLDVVVANAGIAPEYRPAWELTEEQWRDVIDIDLSGVWKTVKSAVPAMIEAGNGGSIVLIGSTASTHSYPGISHYSAAKHGLIGFMNSLAQEVAEYGIRVNTVTPGGVDTQILMNPKLFKTLRPDLDAPTVEDAAAVLRTMTLLPVPWVEVSDVTHAVMYLASDHSRYVTGATIPVDAGTVVK